MRIENQERAAQENPIQHPGIRDKWEAKIANAPLKEQLEILADIQRQYDEAKAQWSALYAKTEMHQRDAEYVAQIIASRLPIAVVEYVKKAKVQS
jgi:hypothetical protein